MTLEAKIVFDLSDISRIRVVCSRCGAEHTYPPQPPKDTVANVPAQCGGCGTTWDRWERERKLLTLIRALVEVPCEQPTVSLRIEIDDPYRTHND